MYGFYVILGLIPTIMLIVYLFRNYIRSMVLDLCVKVILKASKHFYASQESIEVGKRYVCIPYSYHGIKYRIYVPFSRTLRRKMLNTKCTLVHDDGTTTDITQQPGCCHMVTASSLGGKEIILEDNNGVVYTFGADEIPVLP